MAVAFPNKAYFPLLDLLRGPAALLVFLGHWRNLLFQDLPDLNAPNGGIKAVYLLTSVGYEAVLIFFVLSGCVIAHVIYSMYEKGRWSWGGYLSARLTRLWVVLIPALVLTAGWDQLGMRLAGGAESIYNGIGYAHIMNQPVAQTSGWLVFWGNIFFLGTSLS